MEKCTHLKYTHSSLVTFHDLNIVTGERVEQGRIGIVPVIGRDVAAAALPVLLDRSTILELRELVAATAMRLNPVYFIPFPDLTCYYIGR